MINYTAKYTKIAFGYMGSLLSGLKLLPREKIWKIVGLCFVTHSMRWYLHIMSSERKCHCESGMGPCLEY